MTTYILVLLILIAIMLLILLFRRPTVDISALREDNARLRERLAERLGALSQNAIELKNKLEEDPLILHAKVSYGWNFTIKIENRREYTYHGIKIF